jgi:hypothetical protein
MNVVGCGVSFQSAGNRYRLPRHGHPRQIPAVHVVEPLLESALGWEASFVAYGVSR